MLVQTLSTSQDDDLLQRAAVLLAGIARLSPQRSDAILAADAVPFLVQLMSNDRAKLGAYLALSGLCPAEHGGASAAAAAIAEAGGISLWLSST